MAIHDHVILSNNKIFVRHNDKNTWTLTLKEVQQKDAGVYMCQVNSDPMVFKVHIHAYSLTTCMKIMLFQKGNLIVVVSPTIIDDQSTSSVSVIEGNEANLKCSADGMPRPKVRWRKAGKPLKGVVNVFCFDMNIMNVHF